MDAIQKRILMEVAGLEATPHGAYNIRTNGKSTARSVTANIDIVTKEDGSGIDIFIKPGTVNESVHIPVVLSEAGIKEVVYSEGYVDDLSKKLFAETNILVREYKPKNPL